jgi:hypothetical protein
MGARRLAVLVLALGLAPAVARADGRSVLFGEWAEPPAPGTVTLVRGVPTPAGEELLATRISGEAPKSGKKTKTTGTRPDDARVAPALDANRARLILRSLTVPGWGQATAGHPTSAAVFGTIEAGIWCSFIAFHIQQDLRRVDYENLAHIYAGIDLRGRDEEYRRTVGSYLSSDDYNRYVVFRDAANLYYDDPAAYRAYIAEHSIGGSDAWAWGSVDELLRYRSKRKEEQRAGLRANTALAMAVANRLVSMVHVARISGRAGSAPRSWNLECVPAGGADPTAYRLQVRTRF